MNEEKCARCYTPAAPDASFCESCGAPLAAFGTPTTNNPLGATPSNNTVVIEMTKSQAEAKQLFDQMVAQKISEGYIVQNDTIANRKAANLNLTNVWAGTHTGPTSDGGYDFGSEFRVEYFYNSHTSSWPLMIQTGFGTSPALRVEGS